MVVVDSGSMVFNGDSTMVVGGGDAGTGVAMVRGAGAAEDSDATLVPLFMRRIHAQEQSRVGGAVRCGAAVWEWE